jgi:NADH dehydrogenase
MEKLRDNSMPMKSVNEALDLRSCILQNFEKALLTSDPTERDALMTFVIAGGGPTGVELAGALGELKKHVLPKDYPELDFHRMQIHLIESAPRVLATMNEKASDRSCEFLKELGVNVHTKTLVKDYDGRNVVIEPGEGFRAATLIWTAGVVGVNIPGLPADSILRNGRIAVDSYNLVKGTKNIYAIGDVAYMETKDSPKGHPMVAQVAIQMGRNVGKNLMLAMNGKPLLPFYYHDKGSMATIGRNRAVVESPLITTNGFFAWLLWMLVHLMSLVGFRNRVVVLFNWLVNYISYDRGIRLIIRPFIPKSHRT